MSKPKPVLSKYDFSRRYRKGEFGNASPTWNSFEEYLGSNYSGLVHVRNRTACGQTFYNLLTFSKIQDACKALGEGNYYISAMAPHKEHGTVQGEVQRSPKRYDLTLTSGKWPMREALKSCYTATLYGLHAESALRKWMDVNSYEWVQHLLDIYPDHVVEFSCFDCYWGTVPRRNTVIWEVRRY